MSESFGFILPASTCRISLGLVATWPTFTSPVSPSNDTQSPSFTVVPPTENCLSFSLTTSAPAPTTDGFPIWRPTTAACEVMPPVAVSTPSATSMPWMSSGTVSLRTSSTFLPCCAHSTAWSAVKTTWPEAAPGEAGRPLVSSRQLLPLGRVEHRREQLRQRGRFDQQQRVSSARRSFSFTKSVAMTTDAYPVRLPFRVCSM